ncbi:hypothetical protein PG616_12965 [Riemerella anatipestifer]|nr:hypothetical protein [Riemerella anatipestifer]
MKYNTTMTTQDKLKIITDNIRQKLPRLMELEEGCLVKDKGTDIIGKIVHKNNDEFIFIQWMDDMYVKHSKCSLEYLKNRFKSLGKEPMLTDVLEWAENTDKYLNSFLVLAIDFYGSIYNIDYDSKHIIVGYDKNIKWDLSKPYLKDQSKEVIDFLYNLIENEKITK